FEIRRCSRGSILIHGLAGLRDMRRAAGGFEVECRIALFLGLAFAVGGADLPDAAALMVHADVLADQAVVDERDLGIDSVQDFEVVLAAARGELQLDGRILSAVVRLARANVFGDLDWHGSFYWNRCGCCFRSRSLVLVVWAKMPSAAAAVRSL